jgi:Spy/CpxP family protein refolding chaperone
MWFDDDMLAFDLGDEYYADADEMSGADDEGHGESGGERRVIVRSIRRGPGMESGMGHGLGEGMGMPRGRGGAMLHRGMGGAMRMRLAHLDLTTAQREKLRDLHEVQARKSVQRRADLQLARMDLHKLMRADKPEAGAVNTQIDRVAKLRADAMKATFDTQMQARAVLTPEQWQQLHSPPPGPGGMRHERMDAPDGAPKR